MLAAMDSNNSLKLIDNTFRSGLSQADDHASTSSWWLKPKEVDQFKDEVINSHQNLSASLGGTPHLPNTTPDAGKSTAPKNHSSPSPPGFNQDAGDDNITWLNITEDGEAQQVINVCVEHWQSAGPEEKKMFALFQLQSTSICHHGHLLVICNMIHSGEL
ncbi:hypothetical protein L208DRAFT_1427214 [Tricholoma matsutake]|nr:hypothetical protein L208DRAFT_1427214 [Tricholoma matsutake 945]